MKLTTLVLALALALPLAGLAEASTTASCTPTVVAGRFDGLPCSVVIAVAHSILITIEFGPNTVGTVTVVGQGPGSLTERVETALLFECPSTGHVAFCSPPIQLLVGYAGNWEFTAAPAATATGGIPPYVRMVVTAS